ncbi:PAAR domain-containing protein [Hydrogenimonas sp.]
MPKVALMGHHHSCPSYCGKEPHVGGPVLGGDGACTVNGIPVATVGTQCKCNCGGPDVITEGTPALTINGIPVAVEGSATAHGGAIVQGDPALTID